jgi:predicted AAA+ superfamily ATPase
MSSSDYISRICDRELHDALNTTGAVLVEGPKWCGKTSTCEHAAQSVIYLQDPDHTESYLNLAETTPSWLLRGEIPRLIDEWQMAPVLWDAVRFEVDRRGEPGQFILTGSAVPPQNATAHTGIGRITRMRMRPMSLFESDESNGTVSLSALFNGTQGPAEPTSTTVERLAFALCRGGWPATLSRPEKAALRLPQNYLEMVIHEDISEVDGVDKDPARVRVLLQSLARNVATLASHQTIVDDVSANQKSLSEKTVASYMNALRRIFVLEDLPAWAPALRSKTAIRTADKRLFVDPSLAAAALRLRPESLMLDFNTFGLLFENLCARDLRVYAQANDGDVFHYRDKNNLEADLIVQLRNGQWAAIEVKMGHRELDTAAQHLLKLQSKVDEGRMGAPAFLMILTATSIPYQRPDGVWVVPLACLRD